MNHSVADDAVSIEGLSLFRADRSEAISGKKRGGCLCIHTNRRWCRNVKRTLSHCSPISKLLTSKCCHFYLPWEFFVIPISAVYMPLDADTKETLNAFYNSINEL